MRYDFYRELREILVSQQARSVILSGNVYDLFFDGKDYVPLIPFITGKLKEADGLIRILYEQNKPVRILNGRDKIKNAFVENRAGIDRDTLLLQD